MLKTLSKCIGEYKKKTILAPLLIMLEVSLEIVIPFIMGELINIFSAYSSGVGYQGLFTSATDLLTKNDLITYIAVYGGAMLLLATCSLFVGIWAGKLSSEAAAGFAYNLRKKMYNNIQNYSFSNINKYSTASLITRQTTDVTNVQNAFQMLLRICIRAPFMFIMACIMCVIKSPELSLIFIIAAILLGLLIVLVGRTIFPLFRKLFAKYDTMNVVMQEDLVAMRVVKSYVREDHEIAKMKEVSQEVYDYGVKAEKRLVVLQPMMQITLYVSMILLAILGGNMFINGSINAGDLSSLSQYSIMILMSVLMVAMTFSMVMMARSSGERIAEIINEESEIKNPENPIMEVADGSISFKNVKFNYKARDDKYVLNNINIDIKSGEVVGIIGGTGSAKTTLVQLIPRLYDATNGEVFVGGKNVKEYDLDVLRNNVAMVLQKNVLFSGSIKENLRWGNENATDEELVEVCKQAQAHDFIQNLPYQYDYDLGQGGVNVSGGQKQRLCIARALLKKPKIIIFDDSTSAIDTKTDALIREQLQKFNPELTKIFIAQRIASIENADRIIVMDKGEIVAFDTHENLLKNCDIYKDVYESQNKGGNK